MKLSTSSWRLAANASSVAEFEVKTFPESCCIFSKHLNQISVFKYVSVLGALTDDKLNKILDKGNINLLIINYVMVMSNYRKIIICN